MQIGKHALQQRRWPRPRPASCQALAPLRTPRRDGMWRTCVNHAPGAIHHRVSTTLQSTLKAAMPGHRHYRLVLPFDPVGRYRQREQADHQSLGEEVASRACAISASGWSRAIWKVRPSPIAHDARACHWRDGWPEIQGELFASRCQADLFSSGCTGTAAPIRANLGPREASRKRASLAVQQAGSLAGARESRSCGLFGRRRVG